MCTLAFLHFPFTKTLTQPLTSQCKLLQLWKNGHHLELQKLKVPSCLLYIFWFFLDFLDGSST